VELHLGTDPTVVLLVDQFYLASAIQQVLGCNVEPLNGVDKERVVKPWGLCIIQALYASPHEISRIRSLRIKLASYWFS
jgi:hypothetical protein